LLLNKEQQQQQLKREKAQSMAAETTTVQEIQRELIQKNTKIEQLEKKIEQLEKNDSVNNAQNSKRTDNSSKPEVDQFQKLKQKYFFTLAINIKMMQSLSDMDVNALYTRIMADKIPVEEWDSWILAHANDKDTLF